MADFDDLESDFERACRLGRENTALQQQVAELEAERDKLLENPCSDCLEYKDDGTPYTGYGWNENRVEGQIPCSCIEESGPYQVLSAQMEKLSGPLNELCEAIDFYDKTLAASADERMAVGTDHHNWLLAAARKLVAAAKS